MTSTGPMAIQPGPSPNQQYNNPNTPNATMSMTMPINTIGTASSTRNPSKVGMMGQCFFTSRSELLTWVNSTLQTNLTKVEQCSSGAVYCQLIDAAHGGKTNAVRMNKVNWNAKSNAPESISNFKVLQSAFDQLRVDRNIEVDKLIRGKYQDNLEFLQWVKHYYDSTVQKEGGGGPGSNGYDPIMRREASLSGVRNSNNLPSWVLTSASVGDHSGGNGIGESDIQSSSSQNLLGSSGHINNRGGPRNTRPTGNRTGPPGSNNNNSTRDRLGDSTNSLPKNNNVNKGPGPPPGPRNSTNTRQLNAENLELKSTVDALETERDYYFAKLREIEILCQNLDPNESGSVEQLSKYSAAELIAEVQRILYKEE